MDLETMEEQISRESRPHKARSKYQILTAIADTLALELPNATGLEKVILERSDAYNDIELNQIESKHRRLRMAFGHNAPTYLIDEVLSDSRNERAENVLRKSWGLEP